MRQGTKVQVQECWKQNWKYGLMLECLPNIQTTDGSCLGSSKVEAGGSGAQAKFSAT